MFSEHDHGTSVVTRYGYKLDTDGDTIVIGSPSEGSDPWVTPPVVGAGAVYVYEQGPAGWQETAKLSASDATPGAFFGADVVVRGDQILVGAAQAGAVYVYERGPAGWSEVQIITPSVAQPGDPRRRTIRILRVMVGRISAAVNVLQRYRRIRAQTADARTVGRLIEG